MNKNYLVHDIVSDSRTFDSQQPATPRSTRRRSPKSSRRFRAPWLFATVWCALGTAPLGALTPTDSPSLDPLASKQEMIRDRFKRFEDRVFRLREQLSLTEPANAERLARVLERAGEAQLGEQLEQLIELLRDPSAVTRASDDQQKWLDDADRLLNLLLEQDSDNQDRKDEIERLKEYQEKLDQLLEQEKQLREEAAHSADARRLAQQLDQAIRRVDALLGKQGGIAEATKKDDADPSEVDGKQQQAAREGQELAEDVDKLAKPADESKPESDAMSEAREGAAAAAESLKQGAGAMSKASKDLSSKNADAAKEAQDEAKEQLEAAKKKLEEAKRALEEQQSTKQQAEKQKQTAQAAKSLSEQMQQESGAQGEGPQGGKPGKSTPGQQNLDQAQQQMDGAAESLEKENPEGATPQQDRAIQELEQARRELENALQQLRKEERAEMLRDLEARFRELLDKQRAVNAETVRLEGVGRDKFGRAENLQLADLATQQRSLADQAGVCRHILEEEGTTIVFPRVVEQIAQDMNTVGDRLAESDVGTITQTIEQDIVDALEQMLDAVKKMQEENDQSGGGSGGKGGDDQEKPLLPSSAELKLLRSAQLRVNTRTTTIETARKDGSEPADKVADALRAAFNRQNECKEMAGEMRDRQKD